MKICNMSTEITQPYHLKFSNDPFDNTLTIPIQVKGNDPYLGLHLKQNEDYNRIQLIDCVHGTPAAKNLDGNQPYGMDL